MNMSNRIKSSSLLLVLSMLLFAGISYAQVANQTHSLQPLPRPDLNYSNSSNATHSLQPLPRPSTNSTYVNSTIANDSNVTRSPSIFPRPNLTITSTNSTSTQQDPISGFFSGIASFFSKLFS